VECRRGIIDQPNTMASRGTDGDVNLSKHEDRKRGLKKFIKDVA
jgi:hypothetical protein